MNCSHAWCVTQQACRAERGEITTGWRGAGRGVTVGIRRDGACARLARGYADFFNAATGADGCDGPYARSGGANPHDLPST